MINETLETECSECRTLSARSLPHSVNDEELVPFWGELSRTAPLGAAEWRLSLCMGRRLKYIWSNVADIGVRLSVSLASVYFSNALRRLTKKRAKYIIKYIMTYIMTYRVQIGLISSEKRNANTLVFLRRHEVKQINNVLINMVN